MKMGFSGAHALKPTHSRGHCSPHVEGVRGGPFDPTGDPGHANPRNCLRQGIKCQSRPMADSM